MAIHFNIFRVPRAARQEEIQSYYVLLYVLFFFVLVGIPQKLDTKIKIAGGCILIPFILSPIAYWAVVIGYDGIERTLKFISQTGVTTVLIGSFMGPYIFGGFFLSIPMLLYCVVYRFCPGLLGFVVLDHRVVPFTEN
jgi:hypothetical protein